MFRTERLYTEEVDDILKRHAHVLKAIYSRYRLRPISGGLRPKLVKLDGWLAFIEDAKVLDSHVTLLDAQLAYLWSRMTVVDELKDFERLVSITFVDFLEAVCRLADLKPLPSHSELDAAGYDSIAMWHRDKEAGTLGEGDASFVPRESFNFGVPKTRPLYAKLDIFLELVFNQLYFDPAQPENVHSEDALLKMLKKADKELGS